MKSVFTISVFIICMLQNAYGQTVRKSRFDTTAKGFINIPSSVSLPAFSAGDSSTPIFRPSRGLHDAPLGAKAL
jgi:hypothetical protein